MTHTLLIRRAGAKPVVWTDEDDAAVAEAAQVFATEVGTKRGAAFTTEGRIKAFDKDAPEIQIVPQYQGG